MKLVNDISMVQPSVYVKDETVARVASIGEWPITEAVVLMMFWPAFDFPDMI